MLNKKTILITLGIILKIIVCINFFFNIMILTELLMNIKEYTVLYVFEQTDKFSILNNTDRVLIAQVSIILHIMCNILLLLCVANIIKKVKLKIIISIIILFIFFFINIRNHHILYDNFDVIHQYKNYIVEIDSSNQSMDTSGELTINENTKKNNQIKSIIITIMIISYITLWVSVHGNVYWHSLQNVFTTHNENINKADIVISAVHKEMDIPVKQEHIHSVNNTNKNGLEEQTKTIEEENKKTSSKEEVNTSFEEEVIISSGEGEIKKRTELDLRIKETYNSLENYLKNNKMDIFQREELKTKIGNVYDNMEISQKKELLNLLEKISKEASQLDRISNWKDETQMLLGRSSNAIEYNKILHNQIVKLQGTVHDISTNHLQRGTLKGLMEDQLLRRISNVLSAKNDVMENAFYMKDLNHYINIMVTATQNNIKHVMLVELNSEEISQYLYTGGKLVENQQNVCRLFMSFVNDFGF